MASVTNRIKEIKQPMGGYLSIKKFDEIDLEDETPLHDVENVHASIMGMAVDYMTRFMLGDKVEKAFTVSFLGAESAESFGYIRNARRVARELATHVKGLDDESIIAACKLVSFDVWYRSTRTAMKGCKDYSETNPDKDTIDNVRILVNRGLNFFNKFGPRTCDGFDFDEDGYTATVDTGDGDFLTKDTLWDFKVSKSLPTTKNTLQIIMYYIMGKHSKQRKYDDINKIGIFNPRLNKVFIYDMRNLSSDIIKEIETDVICY